MKNKNEDKASLREQMNLRVWSLLDDFKEDTSFAAQCILRDEIVSLICDSTSSWKAKPVDCGDDWSEKKEMWIAR